MLTTGTASTVAAATVLAAALTLASGETASAAVVNSTSELDATWLPTLPPCMDDVDCEAKHKLTGHVCMQFFCHPATADGQSDDDDDVGATTSPFQACRTSLDCGDGRKCFRHHLRRTIKYGVCSVERECASHDECASLNGDKCCVGHCCSSAYFAAISRFECTTDEWCRNTLLGDACCIDILGSTRFHSARANWDKVCCSNDRGPFVQPPDDVWRDNDAVVGKIDAQLRRMPLLKESMCKSFGDVLQHRLTQCAAYLTTVAPPPTTQPAPSSSSSASSDSAAHNSQSQLLAAGGGGEANRATRSTPVAFASSHTTLQHLCRASMSSVVAICLTLAVPYVLAVLVDA